MSNLEFEGTLLANPNTSWEAPSFEKKLPLLTNPSSTKNKT
jgi:hypothetical protein